MVEVANKLDLAQGTFGIHQVVKSVGNLLNGHFLAGLRVSSRAGSTMSGMVLTYYAGI
jgi:hypothetical protein